MSVVMRDTCERTVVIVVVIETCEIAVVRAVLLESCCESSRVVTVLIPKIYKKKVSMVLKNKNQKKVHIVTNYPRELWFVTKSNARG